MNLCSGSRHAAALAVVALASASAHATMYSWNFVKGQAGLGTTYNTGDATMPGGAVESINSTFDSTTKRLTFDTFFSGTTAAPGTPITSGFWLVLDNGPNPKTHAGELAIYYFDAHTLSSPKLTVYGYNGENSSNSWSDGAADQAGNQTPDLIKGSNETAGFINSIVAETVTIAGVQYRHFKFDINAASIISHVPTYPESSPWFGTGFDSHLGIWFHPVDDLNVVSYDGTRGAVNPGTPTPSTFFDGENFTTTIIPSPASAALVGIGGLIGMRRRRV